NEELDALDSRPERIVDPREEPIDPAAGQRGDGDRIPASEQVPQRGIRIQPIRLVEGNDRRTLRQIKLREQGLDSADLIVEPWITGIDDVYQDVRFGQLLERRLEGGDELMGQLLDEADRVGQHERSVRRD